MRRATFTIATVFAIAAIGQGASVPNTSRSSARNHRQPFNGSPSSSSSSAPSSVG
jgi:hypothetical protein